MKSKKKKGSREISVFIASPGDLAPERKIFKDVIDDLNSGFAAGAGVRLTALGWEDVLAQTGRRVQSVINRQIEQSDVFVLVLHRRWGQDAPDSKASSYTEEEFRLAFELWKKKRSPEVLIFFKAVDSQSLADPGEQLKKVLSFRKELEEGHTALMRRFNTDSDFGVEIDRHLREFIGGGWDDLEDQSAVVSFSQGTIQGLDKAKQRGTKRIEKQTKQKTALTTRTAVARKQAKADMSLVKMNQKDLALARAAVAAGENGRMQDASILFAQATESTTELSILSAAAEFFQKIGDLENATRLKQRQVAIARDVTVAARYYMELMPQEVVETSRLQVMNQILANYEPAVAEELQSIFDEAFNAETLRKIALESMVNHYTEAEIVQLARFAASPVGQSFLQKQPIIMVESMVRGKELMMSVLLKRHPEFAAEMRGDAALPTSDGPKLLQG